MPTQKSCTWNLTSGILKKVVMYKYVLERADKIKLQEFVFETHDKVFYPTDTSKLLIEACRIENRKSRKVLDLGCGCGVVGLMIAKIGLACEPVFASDISPQAVNIFKKNASRLAVDCIARCGSLFEPWGNEKFDLIVDDVAGISDDIATISSWYPPGVDCNAGRDGTNWIVKIIEQSSQYLTETGSIVFPVLSLSNEGKILDAARHAYSFCELVIKKDWFLPDDIAEKTDILIPLIEDGSIKCQKKFGKWIWSTYIYKAYNQN